MTVTTARKQIQQIDRKVDAIRKRLCSMERVNRMSAISWQKAWDKHPELHKQECALFRKRGQLQVIVGAADAKVDAKLERARKRAEVKAAKASTGVFMYLYECKRSAERLGLSALTKYYAAGLQTYNTRVAA